MNGEILSLETAEQLEKLKKENTEMQEIIKKLDKGVNDQYRLINEIIEYCRKTSMTVGEYEDLMKIIEKEKY